MAEKVITFYLVQPHILREIQVERIIQTFKNSFKPGLVILVEDFQLSEWDRLIPQAVIALILKPKLLAFAYIFGEFNYNLKHLVPLGTRILALSQPNNPPT